MTTKAERKAAKRAARQAQTPSPSELLGKKGDEVEETQPTPGEAEAEAPTTEVIPEAEAKVEEPKAEASTLDEIVANLPEELREKALAELGKLRVQAEKNEQAKAFAGFNNALQNAETGIAKYLGDLAEAHKVSLAGRKITVIYPKADEDGNTPAISNTPKGARNSGGNGSGKGFPPGWGEAQEIGKDGEVIQKATSPSKLAEAMGLQVEGMRDMKDVFENPKERGTKNDLPKRYRVEASRGEYFRVIRTS